MSKLTFKELIDVLGGRLKRFNLVQAIAGKGTSSSKNSQPQNSQPLWAEQNNPDGSGKAPEPDDRSSGSNKPTNQTPNRKPEQDGPPDLDELWNDFNRRLGSLFGAKPPKNTDRDSRRDDRKDDKPVYGGQDQDTASQSDRDSSSSNSNYRPSGFGGGGAGGPKSSKPFGDFAIPKIGFSLILAVIVGIWALSGFFIIQEGQAGVVLQFGKYKYTSRPGINWRLPYPIQTHEVVNLSGVRSVEIGRPVMIQATNLKDSSMLTEDENIIDVKFAVQYRLKDPTEYLFTNRDPDAAVVQAAETAVREIVGRSKMDTVLYEGREKIAIDLAASIQKILDSYKVGVLITSVTVQNVQPPEQVQASFDDAVKAGQDQERLKNEGQAYANEIIPRAKGTAARLVQEAEGYKAKVIATAEGDASRFKQIYAEYSKSPQVTRDRMYIDTMQQVYNNVTKVMVDTRSSNPMIYLPLEKLIQQSSEAQSSSSTAVSGNSAAPGVASGASSPPAGTTTPSANTDKRDGLRSRERDLR